MSQNQNNFKVENLFSVKDWVAVVTGGGTGIGLMAAQALANNGAKVYIVGRRKEVLDRTAEVWGQSLAHPSGKLIPLIADIDSKESISKLVEEVGKREKYVNVLVNNAGISKGSSEVEQGEEGAKQLHDELWSESLNDWMDVYKTNVVGHFFTAVAFLPLLSAATESIAGHSGSIINITSISGITRTTQHHFKYNVSKAAANHLNTLLAQEFSRPGVKVRVNAIAPGVFPSEMTTKESDDKNKSYQSAEGWREEKQVPAGRPGKDEDMAQAVLLFAVNQYANGQVTAIDGGYLLGHP
ncbi:unnamed protein product [Peniophora sp. CBMAI 1063]|nr:unnamed protein product [Peniophora sp. CBMAI 1063]